MGADKAISGPDLQDASTGQNLDLAKVYEQVMKSAVQVKSMPGTEAWMATSTGFFVSSDDQHRCEVALSGHVTDGQAQNGHSAIRVTTVDGYSFSGTQILNDAAHQIRIFELENVSNPEKLCHPAQITDRVPKVGELVLGVSSNISAAEPRAFIGQVQGATTRSTQTAIPADHLPKLPGEDLSRGMYMIFGRGEYGDSGGPKFFGDGKLFAIHAASQGSESLSEQAKYLLEDLAKIKAERQAKTQR